MLDGFYFLLRFLRHPRRVASVVPSSARLARELLQDLQLNDGDLVIEYGPGTGAFTVAIDRAIRDGRQIAYLGIESDPGLYRRLTIRFPDLDFACDDVLNVEAIHADRGLGPAKAVISGVPLILMREPDLRQVLTATRSFLRSDGEFRTISYLHSYPSLGAQRLRASMRDEFVEFAVRSPVWLNLPPALVLTGRVSPTSDSSYAIPEPAEANGFVTEHST